MIRKTLLASLLVSVITADIAIAQTPTDTRSMGNVSSQAQSSLDQKSGMQLTDEERSLAKQWMLKESDWIKYKKIMSGPRGIWSPGLDPLTALGVSETDPAERERYAMIWMKVESRRMELELAFEVERMKAAKDLFGENPVVIDAPHWEQEWNEKYNATTTHVALFVNDFCLKDCEDLVSEVRKSVSRNSRLDIFFNDGASAESISKWARHMKIEPEIVRARKVTLNFESGKAEEFGVDLDNLPAVRTFNVASGDITEYGE